MQQPYGTQRAHGSATPYTFQGRPDPLVLALLELGSVRAATGAESAEVGSG
jgi:hypothetical protein